MAEKLLPAHVIGRKFETLTNVQVTIDQKGLDFGGAVRISTKKDSQLSSIEYQKKLLREWAELQNYNLKEVYIDMKSGGYIYNRNDINRMLDDIKKGLIKGVVTKEISRTSRDITDMLNLKRKIVALGGFLISIKEGYDSRVDQDEFFLTLHAAMAQKERKTTASRVKLTQMIKAKEGKTNVPQPAYGYKLNDAGQHIIKNPDTYSVYRLIVGKFLDGWGQLKIAKHLNEFGIPSKRGEKWCTNAIKTILSNPVYLGITIYNATTLVRDVDGKQKRVVRPEEEWVVRENTHEPLITKREFEMIQNIINERKQKDVKEWTCDRKYLGSSILRCADCGGKIYGARHPRKRNGRKIEGEYLYRYYCSGVKGNCNPPMKRWDMEQMDDLILQLYQNIFTDKEKLLATIKEEFQDDESSQGYEDLRDDLRQKLDEIEKAIKKQQIAYEKEVTTIEEYKERISELRKDKQNYLNKLAELNKRLSKKDAAISKLDFIFQQIEGKLEKVQTLSLKEKINLISPVFEAIYINRDYSIADVTFNFF